MTDEKITEQEDKLKRECRTKAEMLSTMSGKMLEELQKEGKKLGFRTGVTIALRLCPLDQPKNDRKYHMELVASNHSVPEIGLLDTAVNCAMEKLENSSPVEDMAFLAELDMRGILDTFMELSKRFRVVYTVLKAMKGDPKFIELLSELGESDQMKEVIRAFTEGEK